MLKRLGTLLKVLRGECILLIPVGADTLVVEPGKRTAAELKSAACTFFRTTYSLT